MDINENIYRTNGFRILGLDITSKNRKIDNRIAKVDRFRQRKDFSDTEPLKGVFDRSRLGFLLPVKPEPSYYEYQDAKNRLKDVETRLVDEIFWFWPKTFDSQLDEEVVEYLKENKYNKAISYWGNVSDTNTMNMTSIHNLAVLYHVRALDGFLDGKGNKDLFSDLELSLNYWSQIVNSNNFKDYVKERVNSLNDPRLNEEFVDKIFDDLPHDLLNINYLLLKKTLNSGKLSKRKQDYVNKYVNSIRNSPFEKSLISSFNSKIINAIDESINRFKDPFEKSFDSNENDDEKHNLLFEYCDNIIPYLYCLHNSFNDDIISNNVLNNSCRFIYNRIPNPLILILYKVSDEDKFNKFIEISESLKEFTTADELKERFDSIIQLKDIDKDPQPFDEDPQPELYTASINVRDDDGDGLSNVDVILTNVDTDKRYFGETNSYGSCNIGDLPAGKYYYKAAKMGYEIHDGNIKISDNYDLRINLKKEKQVVTPPPPVTPPGGSSYNKKFYLMFGAIILMAIAYYVAVNFL